MQHPLEGVKVIEIATYAPANMAAGWLADLGADIIVVEPPSNRALGPEWDKSDRIRHVENRNKRGIGLNLKDPEGQAILHRLVQDADILIEANRPGVAKRLGYDYETLSRINPRIIVCSSTGYGQQGPMSHLPGHGRVWEATGGWLLTQGMGLGNMGGDYTGEPYMNPFNLADIKSAPYILSTILAALYARTVTGEGQHLDIALFDAVIAVRNPEAPARGGEAWERHTAANGAYVCKDGRYIAFAVSETLQWANMCRGLGFPEFAPEFRPGNDRADEIRAIFARRILEKTRDEWFAELSQYDMEVAPVLTLDESAAHPQVQLRNMHVEVTDDAGYRQVQYGAPFHLSKTPPKTKHRRAPKFGEHTESVLADLGYSAAEIRRLSDAGTVIARPA